MLYAIDLVEVFENEYMTLSPSDQRRVLADYTTAVIEDSCLADEYHHRIGTGNLASYAACLCAGATK